MNNKNIAKIPAYSEFIYADRYKDLKVGDRLDSNFSSKLRMFFQYNTLTSSMLRNIKINQKVLQIGAVFGNEIDQVAQAVGAYGQFDVIDVNSIQINRNKDKYGSIYPCLHFFEQDAANLQLEQKYDVVICFLLLQELPISTKMKVVDNALNAVKDGGCAIFVDYHNPLYWHPLRYIVRMYNRLRHPFVEKLWDRDIDTFASPKNKVEFSWKKSTYFGRMFQKVVATKKSGITDIISKEEDDDESIESYFLPDF